VRGCPTRHGWTICPARARPSWIIRGACPLHDHEVRIKEETGGQGQDQGGKDQKVIKYCDKSRVKWRRRIFLIKRRSIFIFIHENFKCYDESIPGSENAIIRPDNNFCITNIFSKEYTFTHSTVSLILFGWIHARLTPHFLQYNFLTSASLFALVPKKSGSSVSSILYQPWTCCCCSNGFGARTYTASYRARGFCRFVRLQSTHFLH
jgi:hypothetical protein